MSVFTKTVDREFIELFLGRKLGAGAHRDTYALNFDANHVVKVEKRRASFQNVEEWNAWSELQHTKWAKFFAPCVSISACGSVLLMKRTTPLTKKIKVKLPNFFTDTKIENFGYIGNRLVCHDYGLNRLRLAGSVRLVQPEWWSLDDD